MSAESLSNILIAIHFLWAAWMVVGVVLSFAGYRYPRIWRLRWFRAAHLVGILLTASVPIWGRGVCPLTRWEWLLQSRRAGSANAGEPFLVRLLRAILYVDIDPAVLSVATAAGAALTFWIYLAHPPRFSREVKRRSEKPVRP